MVIGKMIQITHKRKNWINPIYLCNEKFLLIKKNLQNHLMLLEEYF